MGIVELVRQVDSMGEEKGTDGEQSKPKNRDSNAMHFQYKYNYPEDRRIAKEMKVVIKNWPGITISEFRVHVFIPL